MDINGRVGYIAPVVLNEVGKGKGVCEDFIISETHDACCLILKSLCKIYLGRGESEGYAIFSDEFMTISILESIGMNDTKIFYDHFHMNLNLEK